MAQEPNWEELYQQATKTAQRAHAPYSKLQVGAAGITNSGRLVVGCNVENASYGLTLCAECGLVSSLHSLQNDEDQDTNLVAVAVVDGAGNPLTPCGRCRQLLLEAGGKNLLVNGQPLEEILPDSFGPEDLPS